MRELLRARGRRAVAVQRAEKSFTGAVRTMVSHTVDLLDNPTPFKYARGDQRHFLDRLERLEAEPRELALRLYYHASLARFVARRGLGQPLDHLYAPTLPADGSAPRRLSFALDRGPEPPRVVMEESGQVITCLASGMDGGAQDHPFAELVGLLRDYDDWREQNQSAKARAAEERIAHDVLDVRHHSWWASREAVRGLADLGDAGTLLLEHMLQVDLREFVLAMLAAVTQRGRKDDEDYRQWLYWSGVMAAWCVAMADGNMPPPDKRLVGGILGMTSPQMGMVIGAALTRWYPEDGGALINPTDWQEAHVAPPTVLPAALVYWGTLRQRANRAGLLSRIRALDEGVGS